MIYSVKNLWFNYPLKEDNILQDASLTLAEGEILTILGPNGAGKSTLLNCLAGLIKPTKGEIYLCGNRIDTMSFRQIAQKMSYVQQTHTPTFPYTVLHFVLMGRAPRVGLFQRPTAKDELVAWEALETLNISHLADKPYTEISGGERQQATIARAIVQEPNVILFDEPTSHLDYGNQLRVLRIIKDMSHKGFSIIITTHNPDHAILLNGMVAILDRDGHLNVGKSTDIITEERLKKVYNTDLHLMHVPALSRVACIPPNI